MRSDSRAVSHPRASPRHAGRLAAGAPWLLLVLKLPTTPSNARVKTWRRLQGLGAVAVKNALYVLPNSPQAREDFEWMKGEIRALGGEASVFAATSVDSLTHDEIVARFRSERERDYQIIHKEVRTLIGEARRTKGPGLLRLRRTARQVREHFSQVASIDFFRASGREDAKAALAELERLLTGPAGGTEEQHDASGTLKPQDYRGRIWLTRPRPGIDRAGSAWLIRRFIDPAARFVFADKLERVRAKVVPFDMYDVDFSHHGDQCTFEVLARRFAISDPAVVQLGRLVHDLDLKDSRYDVPEAAVVGRLIDGLRHACPRDPDLLEHAIVVFEALYQTFTDTVPKLVRAKRASRQSRSIRNR